MIKLLLFTFSLATIAMSVAAQTPAQLPKEIAKNYDIKVYSKVSDEFNGKDYDRKKWYRRHGGINNPSLQNYVYDESLVQMKSEGESIAISFL